AAAARWCRSAPPAAWAWWRSSNADCCDRTPNQGWPTTHENAGGGRALVSICTAGGMGVVAIVER
ncbi:hypothetical protein C7E25_24620, partial [Stenotrophomonas maltophilia]